jgi:hypothetical protein
MKRKMKRRMKKMTMKKETPPTQMTKGRRRKTGMGMVKMEMKKTKRRRLMEGMRLRWKRKMVMSKKGGGDMTCGIALRCAGHLAKGRTWRPTCGIALRCAGHLAKGRSSGHRVPHAEFCTTEWGLPLPGIIGKGGKKYFILSYGHLSTPIYLGLKALLLLLFMVCCYVNPFSDARSYF